MPSSFTFHTPTTGGDDGDDGDDVVVAKVEKTSDIVAFVREGGNKCL